MDFEQDFFKMIGIIIVCCFIIYLIIKMFKLQKNMVEGLISGSTTSDSNSNSTTTTNDSGIAGFANSYSAAIKAKTIKLQDELLVSKYLKDYEQVIINLDDYLGYLMIKQTLNLNTNINTNITDVKDNISSLNTLNILKNARDSLNDTMIFLDKI